MKRILAILALIASAVALYAAAVAPTADPVHPGNYTNKELLRYIADYTQDGYVLATAPAADPVHPGNLTEKELLRYIADYTQQGTGGGDFLADGSVPMTGALTFSGTTHPGLRLNPLTSTQRDAFTPLFGYIIANTTTSAVEWYNGSVWTGIGGSGTSRTIADLSTVYSAPTWTLAAGTDYYGTANGARTVALPGSPTAGDLINITQLIVSSGPITVTLPPAVVYRAGTVSNVTSISLPTGNHSLSFEYVNSTWVLRDTGVDAEAAYTVYGNPTSGALAPVMTDSPVVNNLTANTAIELSSATANTLTASGGNLSIEGVELAKRTGGNTFSGAQTLAENASVALDPAGSADGKYSGTTITGTGGDTIAFGDLVTLDKDDSRWEKVDISVAAAATGDARGIFGIAVTSSTDGGAITVLLSGVVRADANFPTLTIGAAVYASTTGDVTSTQPTTTDHVIRIIGYALTADEIYFCPSGTWTTHT